MADWEAEDFEPEGFKSNQSTDKWEGEDEDEDVKENWDDDEDEEEKEQKTTETKPAPVKKKRNLKEIIKEKEEKKRQEALERAEERKRQEESAKSTTEDEQAEKLRRQKLVEESDLEIAKDAFGLQGDALLGKTTIDTFVPETRQQFLELSGLIVNKLTAFESEADYEFFLETMFRDLCTSLDPEVVKRLGSTLNVLSSEKLKAQKAKKGKKGGKKATLVGAAKAGRKDDLDDYGNYGEYDDFM